VHFCAHTSAKFERWEDGYERAICFAVDILGASEVRFSLKEFVRYLKALALVRAGACYRNCHSCNEQKKEEKNTGRKREILRSSKTQAKETPFGVLQSECFCEESREVEII